LIFWGDNFDLIIFSQKTNKFKTKIKYAPTGIGRNDYFFQNKLLKLML